jgi:hypothetical protein
MCSDAAKSTIREPVHPPEKNATNSSENKTRYRGQPVNNNCSCNRLIQSNEMHKAESLNFGTSEVEPRIFETRFFANEQLPEKK